MRSKKQRKAFIVTDKLIWWIVVIAFAIALIGVYLHLRDVTITELIPWL